MRSSLIIKELPRSSRMTLYVRVLVRHSDCEGRRDPAHPGSGDVRLCQRETRARCNRVARPAGAVADRSAHTVRSILRFQSPRHDLGRRCIGLVSRRRAYWSSDIYCSPAPDPDRQLRTDAHRRDHADH